MNKARKIIAGLLAIYMLALVFMPCHDTCGTQTQQTATTIQAQHDSNQNDNDICSPFCTCSCCSSYITLTFFPEFKSFFAQSTKQFSDYQQTFVSAFFADFFQPPQLS